MKRRGTNEWTNEKTTSLSILIKTRPHQLDQQMQISHAQCEQIYPCMCRCAHTYKDTFIEQTSLMKEKRKREFLLRFFLLLCKWIFRQLIEETKYINRVVSTFNFLIRRRREKKNTFRVFCSVSFDHFVSISKLILQSYTICTARKIENETNYHYYCCCCHVASSSSSSFVSFILSLSNWCVYQLFDFRIVISYSTLCYKNKNIILCRVISVSMSTDKTIS